MKGVIKTLTDRGFGFITPEGENAKDIFFHTSSLSGVKFEDLNVGDAVTFEIENSPKGPRAGSVQLAKAE